jgi:hypothetical protein
MVVLTDVNIQINHVLPIVAQYLGVGLFTNGLNILYDHEPESV